jgi:glycosyltransferase involved in cell wall biosynthesis
MLSDVYFPRVKRRLDLDTFEKNIGFPHLGARAPLHRYARRAPRHRGRRTRAGPRSGATSQPAGSRTTRCSSATSTATAPLLDCYRSADAFVFASRTETQGLVLLEAMALGLPVVSTAVMGTRYVLDGARGAIVVNEDAVQFAAAVEMVLKNHEMRISLGAQAAMHARTRWSGAEMARRMLDLYQSAIRRHERASRSAARALVDRLTGAQE